ncbi:hypothetical protein EVAR_3430_1 [Eumeta japonica]|uniref:Uncharacterized protein n=1 Tax=Eumeta variegata TaxID=151549 RepID=A0A4C1SSK0_EUMVA|nr:hypothetical protein EVAR_3430_1 [Eumeta japonica]
MDKIAKLRLGTCAPGQSGNSQFGESAPDAVSPRRPGAPGQSGNSQFGESASRRRLAQASGRAGTVREQSVRGVGLPTPSRPGVRARRDSPGTVSSGSRPPDAVSPRRPGAPGQSGNSQFGESASRRRLAQASGRAGTVREQSVRGVGLPTPSRPGVRARRDSPGTVSSGVGLPTPSRPGVRRAGTVREQSVRESASRRRLAQASGCAGTVRNSQFGESAPDAVSPRRPGAPGQSGNSQFGESASRRRRQASGCAGTSGNSQFGESAPTPSRPGVRARDSPGTVSSGVGLPTPSRPGVRARRDSPGTVSSGSRPPDAVSPRRPGAPGQSGNSQFGESASRRRLAQASGRAGRDRLVAALLLFVSRRFSLLLAISPEKRADPALARVFPFSHVRARAKNFS